MRSASAALLVLSLLFLSLAARAQDTAPTERRTIAVSVVDKDGRFVEGLTGADFRGSFRGQPVTIQTAVRSKPSRVVLLVDTSKGVRRNPSKWQLAWAAVRDFVRDMDSERPIDVITFSERVLLHNPIPRVGEQPTEELLKDLQAEAEEHDNTTRLYDALIEGARLASDQRAILFVVTDGVDTTSVTDFPVVRDTLAQLAARPFFFLLPPDPIEHPSARVRARRQNRELVEACGGGIFDHSRNLNNKLPLASSAHTYDQIAHMYELPIDLPQPVDKPREWKLEVVGPDGKRRKDLTLAYPRLLVPLTPSQQQRRSGKGGPSLP